MKARVTGKLNSARSVTLRGNASKTYSRIRKHLDFIRKIKVSETAAPPFLPNMFLKAVLNELIADFELHLNTLSNLITTPDIETQ